MIKLQSSISWFDKIKKEIHDINSDIEVCAEEITDNKSENDSKIINLLKSIDFSSSNLSQEVLNKKTKPDQWCGDLEYAVMILVSHLESNAQYNNEMDMSEIDKSLYLIAKMFQGAIINGEMETAFAAKAGLLTGFFRIRDKAFSLDDEVRDNYIKDCKKYLDNYYLYVSVKNIIDKSIVNLNQRQQSLLNESKKFESAKQKMAHMIIKSPKLFEQIKRSLFQTYMQSHLLWTSEIIELYQMLVELRIVQSELTFKGYMLETEEKHIYFYREIATKLEDMIRNIPVPEDKNILSKMESMMEDTLEEAEKIDNDFDKLEQLMNDFDERFKDIGKNRRQLKTVTTTINDINKKTEDFPS